MEYYIGIIHQGGENDDRIVSTSLRSVSKFVGVPEHKLSYRFRTLGKTHYMELDPWISVWVTNNFVKQRRPQYTDPAYRRKE